MENVHIILHQMMTTLDSILNFWHPLSLNYTQAKLLLKSQHPKPKCQNQMSTWGKSTSLWSYFLSRDTRGDQPLDHQNLMSRVCHLWPRSRLAEKTDTSHDLSRRAEKQCKICRSVRLSQRNTYCTTYKSDKDYILNHCNNRMFMQTFTCNTILSTKLTRNFKASNILLRDPKNYQ